MAQEQYNQYYLAVYVDSDNFTADYEEVNNKLWDFVEKELDKPLHLDMVYDHGYGDWFDWFQVEFRDKDHTEKIQEKLQSLSGQHNCDFCLAMKNGEREEAREWYYSEGELINDQIYDPEEMFWAIETQDDIMCEFAEDYE